MDRSLVDIMDDLVDTMRVVSEDRRLQTVPSMDDLSASSYTQHTSYPSFLDFDLSVDDASLSQRVSEPPPSSPLIDIVPELLRQQLEMTRIYERWTCRRPQYLDIYISR